MACSRCGAGSGCRCALVPGYGIDVSGTGDPNNPWTISRLPIPCPEIKACETLTSISRIAPLRIQYNDEHGGITILDLCADVKDCETLTSLSFAGGPNRLLYTDEDGTVNVVPLPSETITTLTRTGPLQLTYMSESGVPAVIDLCADVAACETQTSLVPDGAGGYIYTSENGTQYPIGAPPVQPQTPITVIDTETVNLTASGQDNHTITAEVRFGCGLTSDVFGLRANTFNWGFGCNVSNGMPVYCDNDGRLRSNPDHTSVEFGRPADTGPFVIINGGESTQTGVNINVTNPSTCRSMTFMSGASYSGASQCNSPGFQQGRARANFSQTLFGGPVIGPFGLCEWDPGACASAGSFGFYATSGVSDTWVMGPGAGMLHQSISIIENMGGVGFAGRPSVAQSILGVTR